MFFYFIYRCLHRLYTIINDVDVIMFSVDYDRDLKPVEKEREIIGIEAREYKEGEQELSTLSSYPHPN